MKTPNFRLATSYNLYLKREELQKISKNEYLTLLFFPFIPVEVSNDIYILFSDSAVNMTTTGLLLMIALIVVSIIR